MSKWEIQKSREQKQGDRAQAYATDDAGMSGETRDDLKCDL